MLEWDGRDASGLAARLRALAPPLSVARRAYGMLSRIFSAAMAMAIAAT